MADNFGKGSVNRTVAKNIPLTLSNENLKTLLSSIAENKSEYNHFDVAEWCDKYLWEILRSDLEYDSFGIDEKTYDVLEDVSVQWELTLVNTYTIEELKTMDFSKVHLPREWFQEWLNELV